MRWQRRWSVAHRSATICHLVSVARDIGRRLRWNPDKELFVVADEANRHPSVTRARSAGYELPETQIHWQND